MPRSAADEAGRSGNGGSPSDEVALQAGRSAAASILAHPPVGAASAVGGAGPALPVIGGSIRGRAGAEKKMYQVESRGLASQI
eukprot:scaffold23111_cov117-Isochrysis_galbana.AAC.1